MLFDPDHMSVKARQASMDLIEDLDYPGVMSSHSWSTPDTYPRIYKAGGFIAPYAGDSTGFVDKWRTAPRVGRPPLLLGSSASAPTSTASARRATRAAPTCPTRSRYPFTGINGVQVDKQRAGERVWDINVDGVAQYGLYPDWVEDLGLVADTQHDGDGGPDPGRHGARHRGLPPDVGAGGRHQGRLVPQPRAAEDGRGRSSGWSSPA